MFFAVILTTFSLFISTLTASFITRASIPIYETLKISMLATIFLVLSVIFTTQVMQKSPLLMYSFIPLYFLSIFTSIKNVSGISNAGAAIITTINIIVLTIIPKLLGIALFANA
jgi:hypothetical protein